MKISQEMPLLALKLHRPPSMIIGNVILSSPEMIKKSLGRYSFICILWHKSPEASLIPIILAYFSANFLTVKGSIFDEVLPGTLYKIISTGDLSAILL